MNTISVCLIVKNEEEVLERCLTCVKSFADEIIVVDTGSTDNSKNIAKKFTNKLYDYIWQDDFSKARNYAFSFASSDYVMWLDADDIVLEEDALKLWDFKLSKHSDIDMLMLKYVTGYEENYTPTFSFYRERVLKRSANFKFEDPVHEVIVPRGKIVYMDINIYHAKVKTGESNRNLNIYQKYIKNGEKLSPRQQFYYARELMYNNLIDEAILNFNKFLNIKEGWIENKIEACLNLAKCYKAKNDFQKAKESLVKTFTMARPRSEVLCELGNLFLSENQLDEAVYCYRQARLNKPNVKSGGFVLGDCYSFLPNLQLSVCYYRKGKMRLAKRYHEKAKQEKPKHPSILYNEKYFNNK